ncbi:hypothetical protein AGMMS49579_23530 [Spirochaetia bacterium]|nr:hypothetical protein AGMMS49579_23530 [Spirochaetia bacterium]
MFPHVRKDLNEKSSDTSPFRARRFISFKDINKLIDEIEKDGDYFGIQAFDMDRLAQFFLYFSTKERLERTLVNFINKRKGWDKYNKALEYIGKNEQLYGEEWYWWTEIAEITKKLCLNIKKE